MESEENNRDKLTAGDMTQYRPSTEDMDDKITRRLATLDPPYTYERKQDGEVLIYSVKYAEIELGRITLSPRLVTPSYRLFTVRDETEMQRRLQLFHFVYKPILDQVMNSVRARKVHDKPQTHPEITARRQKVKQLKMDGWLRREIARQVNVTEDVVKKDLEFLRKNGELSKK